MANSLNPRFVDVGATPVLITNNLVRSKLDLKNTGASEVVLGKNSSMTDGFPLDSGEFQSRAGSANALWALSPGGLTNRVWIWEEQ